MTETQNLKLGLLEAAQAQKHVTVNEALLRLDAACARFALSSQINTPPVSPQDGDTYIVGQNADGAWSGYSNALAYHANGGWVFMAPWSGMRVFVLDQSSFKTFLSGRWLDDSIALSDYAAATRARVIGSIHDVTAGVVSTTAAIIPDKAIVLGVTGRVIDEITGPTSWSLGVTGSADRYGSGYGTQIGSEVFGVTGSPLTYYGASELILTASGGDFIEGRVRLCVHTLELAIPD